MSAAEKESVLQSWLRFFKNGCAWHDFTIQLYEHLTLHCSFIAHYNRLGFYEYYFANPGEQTFRFLDQFDPAKPGVSAEIGMMYWLNGPTASDLNRAMRETTAPCLQEYAIASSSKLSKDIFLMPRRLRESMVSV
jgi:hypothetical protein